jgi:ATP-binding cassette subfamily F protein 3
LGHNVAVGYYSQQSLELPEGLRTIDAVVTGTKLTGPQARTLLGRFLFSGEEVEKPVAALSGGERRRLALLRTVVSGANFLVLDEPTNHLDIESREALEDALLGFPGTLLFVSHDRALIEALATRTLAIEAGRLTARDGGFGDYAQAHAAPRAAAGPAKPAKSTKPARPKEAPERRTSQRAAKQAAKLERAIATLEEELGALETRLSQPEAYEDDALVAEDGTRHQELQEELAYLYREWERHAAEAG